MKKRWSALAAAVPMILAFGQPLAAQEAKIYVDFRVSSPEEWEIVSDEYSASVAAPRAGLVELDGEGKYLGVFFSFQPNSMPTRCFLKAKKEQKNGDMRVVRVVRLNVFGIQAPCSLGVVFEDGKKNLHEIQMGDIDFLGWRRIEFAGSLPVNGLVLKGIALYPSRSGSDKGGDVAVYLRDLEIRGDTGTGRKP